MLLVQGSKPDPTRPHHSSIHEAALLGNIQNSINARDRQTGAYPFLLLVQRLHDLFQDLPPGRVLGRFGTFVVLPVRFPLIDRAAFGVRMLANNYPVTFMLDRCIALQMQLQSFDARKILAA